MFDALHQTLATNPLALLFLTIGLGYLLSHVRLFGFELGVAAVLFAGLGLGIWGHGAFALPELVMQLGLLLFVYMIGLSSGPAFFRLLKSRGWAFAALAAVTVGLAFGLTWLLGEVLHLSPALAAGLFCGATTNTPALAAVSEVLRGSPDALLPTVGYSIAYPLGVAVPLLLAELGLRSFRVDVPAEAARAERALGDDHAAPAALNLRVTNPAIVGQTVEAMPFSALEVRVSRVQRGEHVLVATPDTRVELGDVLHVVGGSEAVARARLLVGEEAVGVPGPESRRDEVDFRRMFLSNGALVGRRLGDIGLPGRYEAVVTRIRRGDRDFVPTDDTLLERGDRLRVVARTDQVAAVAAYLGDSVRSMAETDFLSLSLGVVLAMAIGAITLPLPGGLGFQLGLAGGALLVSLVVGNLGKTGPIIWTLPNAANNAFRQLGLVLFFSAAGVRAGGHFMSAIAAQGATLLGVGALITLVASVTLLAGATCVLRTDWVTALGALAGGQTQPALLAFAGEKARSEAVNDAYVAIMPTAMIAKILLAQILLWLLVR